MPVVWLKLPDARILSDDRPQCCSYCGSSILQRWGRVSKPIRDATGMLTDIYRYRCIECERTFRHYPKGVDRANQTLRIRQIAGLTWLMGMSTRDVVETFKDVGLKVSRSTVWREGKRLAGVLDALEATNNGRRYSIDKNYVHKVSTKLGVVVALSAKNGREVVLGTLDEHNPRVVKSWMESLVDGIEIEVSVSGTDTLNDYESTELGSLLGPYI